MPSMTQPEGTDTPLAQAASRPERESVATGDHPVGGSVVGDWGRLPGRELTEEHREYLLGAALSAVWIDTQVGDQLLRSTAPGDPMPEGFDWVRAGQQVGIWFGFPKVDGAVKWQLRPDDPADGPKYGSAVGQSLGYAIRRIGKSDVLLIVEGTKQSHAAGSAVAATTTFAPDAGAIAEATVIGIPGCTGWSVDGGLPMDLHLTCRNKRVVILADADAGTNLNVYTAVERLGHELTLARSVKFAHVPGGGKSGLDDVLAQVAEAERPSLLAEIVATATDRPAPKKPTPKSSAQEEDAVPVQGASMVVRESDAYDRIARQLIETRFMHPTERVPTIAFNGGIWWEHTGARWVILDDTAVPDRVWSELAATVVVESPDAPTGRPYPVSKHRRDNVVAGLRARLTVKAPEYLTAPTRWLSWATGKWSVTADASGPLIAFRNVLLTRDPDASGTRHWYGHTPRYWNQTNLDVDFDPDAMSSKALDQLITGAWPDDAACRDLALEILGYIVSGETKLQKAFLCWGKRRGGKGKFLDVCTWLVGEGQTEASGLSELAGQFGLENFPGKSLAVLDDTRGESRFDVARLARRILSITGCALTPVERKGIKNWSGHLPTRILITSNLLLDLRDPTGVLATRFEILPFFESFAGREDLTLGDRLKAELPAIANVALAAYDRLMITQGGKFTRPASAAEDHAQLQAAQSAELAFLDACAELRPQATTPKTMVYQRYVQWCGETGHNAKSDTVFYRDLYSATGRAVSQVRGSDANGNRIQLLKGIELRAVLGGGPSGVRPAPAGPSGVWAASLPGTAASDASAVRGHGQSVRGASGVDGPGAECESAGSGVPCQGCQGCQGSSEAGRNTAHFGEALESSPFVAEGPVRGDTPDTPDAATFTSEELTSLRMLTPATYNALRSASIENLTGIAIDTAPVTLLLTDLAATVQMSPERLRALIRRLDPLLYRAGWLIRERWLAEPGVRSSVRRPGFGDRDFGTERVGYSVVRSLSPVNPHAVATNGAA